jgi:hypothetical protein
MGCTNPNRFYEACLLTDAKRTARKEHTLFVEETMPEGFYQTVWVGEEFQAGLDFLAKHETMNRLELWSNALAASPKGFVPFAFRPKDSKHVLVSNTLKMLMRRETGDML